VGKTARGIGGSDGSSRRHHLETALAPGAKLADIHVSCAPFARAVRDILRAPIRVELCGRTLGHGQRKMSTQLRRMRSDHAQRLARHQLQPGPCEPAAVCRTGRSAHARCFLSRAAHTYRTRRRLVLFPPQSKKLRYPPGSRPPRRTGPESLDAGHTLLACGTLRVLSQPHVAKTRACHRVPYRTVLLPHSLNVPGPPGHGQVII
jgi:hypothetical protein